MRNWYNFTWLSGDFNVEQHVHFLDVCAWIMKEQYPVKAVGMGGRQVLTGNEYGNIYDHFSAWFKNARFRVTLGISARTLIGPALERVYATPG